MESARLPHQYLLTPRLNVNYLTGRFLKVLNRAVVARLIAPLLLVWGMRTVVSGEEARPSVAPRLAGFQLPDQYDRLRTISFPGTNFLILTVADQKGSDQVASWIGPIKERYAKRIEIAGVADMGRIPVLLRGFVRSKFQKRQAYPVMLDWSGKVAEGIGYTPHQAKVLLIHPDGTILVKFSGMAKPEDLKRLFGVLDEGLGNQSINPSVR